MVAVDKSTGRAELRWRSQRSQALSAAERTELSEFAKSSSVGLTTAYVDERFARYPTLLCARDRAGLACFGFVHEFEAGDQTYVYLGPWFSRSGALIPLFAAYYEDLLARFTGSDCHLAAEFQTPTALNALRTLVPSCCHPKFGERGVPTKIQAIAGVYARTLGHIRELDPVTLRTHSEETLFRPTSLGVAAARDLLERGVRLGHKDCQMAIVSVSSETREREQVRAELRFGSARHEARLAVIRSRSATRNLD